MNPSWPNILPMATGSDAAYSMNSKPSVPIGLSHGMNLGCTSLMSKFSAVPRGKVVTGRLFGNYRRHFDLHLRRILDERGDLHRGHRRKMATDDFAIRYSD